MVLRGWLFTCGKQFTKQMNQELVAFGTSDAKEVKPMELTIALQITDGDLVQTAIAGLSMLFCAGSFVLQCLTYKRNKN